MQTIAWCSFRKNAKTRFFSNTKKMLLPMQLYLLPTGVVWRSGVATNLCSRGGHWLDRGWGERVRTCPVCRPLATTLAWCSTVQTTDTNELAAIDDKCNHSCSTMLCWKIAGYLIMITLFCAKFFFLYSDILPTAAYVIGAELVAGLSSCFSFYYFERTIWPQDPYGE